jgi:hypothetical protein
MAPTGERSGAPFVVVLVAIAGLLSTLGAAGLSGYWTNASVKRQFQSQRTAQIQDLRRQVYVDFLQRITEACIARAELDASSGSAEAKAAKANKAITSLLSEGGRAELLATPDVRRSVQKFTASVVHVFDTSIGSGAENGCDNGPLLTSRNSFLTVAERELSNN